ncbi:MAG: hypothetical protein DMF75_03320 [Acidobacteria bacterium]|nr:MAG: hypothetical protein DMF75_03320 [Acidobacteriota bacterium]
MKNTVHGQTLLSHHRSVSIIVRVLLVIVSSAVASSCERNSTVTESNAAATPRVVATAPTPDTISKSSSAMNTGEKLSGFVGDGMPAATVGAFERWLYGNRALSGARWQAPQGHVPGQYVATHRSATASAELLALLDSEDRTAARVTYIALTIRPTSRRTSDLSTQDISEVARAIFGTAVAAKISSSSTSDAKDQNTAPNTKGWEYVIEKQMSGTMLTFYAKK